MVDFARISGAIYSGWRMLLKKSLLLFAAALGGAAFIPVTTLDCPLWDVSVTDRNNHPVAGITVRLSYQNYSAERESHEIDATTDHKGHVVFGARTLTASVARRMVAMVSSAKTGIHSSFGQHARIIAFGNGLVGFDIDPRRNVLVERTGQPDHMESRIVVAPEKHGPR